MNFDQIGWIFWLLLGVGLIVAEIFTLGFVLFWFGIGALAAAAVGFLGFGVIWQFLAFAAVSTGLTVMSRTIFSNYLFHRDEDRLKTAVEALPGKIGTVTGESSGAMNEGAVKVFGSIWTAYPIDEETKLLTGEKVEVVEVKGSSIYVRRVTNDLPEWRDG